MGKKHKALQPNADGFLRTGIYQRRAVPEDISPEKSERRFKEWIDKLKNRPSIQAWLNDWLECCAEIIRPHIDDNGHTTYALNLGDGWRPYRIVDEISDSVEAAQVRDAIDCMNEVRSMSGHIGDDDSLTGDLGWVINAAFRLGHMSEKMKIRPFEPLVASRKRSDAALHKINRYKPSSEELKHKAKDAIKLAEAEYPTRKSDTDFIKTKAAESLDISKRALNLRLNK